MRKCSPEDKALIERHGGPHGLALKTGYSLQRVQNWLARGIPYAEKLAWPELFLASEHQKKVATKLAKAKV